MEALAITLTKEEGAKFGSPKLLYTRIEIRILQDVSSIGGYGMVWYDEKQEFDTVEI